LQSLSIYASCQPGSFFLKSFQSRSETSRISVSSCPPHCYIIAEQSASKPCSMIQRKDPAYLYCFSKNFTFNSIGTYPHIRSVFIPFRNIDDSPLSTGATALPSRPPYHPQHGSFMSSRPTPIRSAAPFARRTSASLRVFTPPVRRTGMETAALTALDIS